MKEFFGKENLSFLINLVKKGLGMKMDKDPNLVISEGDEDTELNPTIDADTLQGHGADYFATKGELEGVYAKTFGKTTAIPAKADLNLYVEPGVYGSGSSAITNSLLNCPDKGAGFVMIVTDATGTGRAVRQVILGLYRIYYRGNTTGGWHSWYVIAGEQIDPVNT